VTRASFQSTAVVALPAVGGRLDDAGIRAWLARATIRRTAPAQPLLARVIDPLGLPEPVAGLAALRMWGQTGERPAVWIAAADPVYLEPRLDHLCLHELGPEAVSKADMRGIFDHLQAQLGDDAGIGFARIGKYGYLRADEPFATADSPTEVVDGRLPNDFLPVGKGADAFRKRLSEIEMALHDAAVNRHREAAGLPPINSLWIWGGGRAREHDAQACPPLFGDDPLLQGYWRSRAGSATAWPGSVAACAEAAAGPFVAVPPIGDGDVAAMQSCLAELRDALLGRCFDTLVLSFRDGIEAQVRRADAIRIWRRRSALLD
jgi:hypothetical protein